MVLVYGNAMISRYILYIFPGFARVLVVGAGGVGIWAVQWARLLFPEGTKIYVADVSVSMHYSYTYKRKTASGPFRAVNISLMTREQPQA